MRIVFCIVVWLLVTGTPARAELPAETITTSTMQRPGPSWFIAKSGGLPYYIFDAATGQMQGQLALSYYTPAVQPNLARGEIYAAESYYSRGVRGQRTDLLAIYDMQTLTPVAEVPIPPKYEPSFFPRHIGLLGNGRHLVIFNMTPGQSVSIVDVESRSYRGEIATTGCSTIMPVQRDDFFLICGDGTIQMIRVDTTGEESLRKRSPAFFSLENDPVSDKPIRSADGWLLHSFENLVYEVTAADERILISEPWSLLDAQTATQGWRIASSQPLAYHRGHDLLYVLMRVGDVNTRDDPATEIWVFHKSQKRRLLRHTLDRPAIAVHVTEEEAPRLLLLDEDATVSVLDGLQLRKLDQIHEVGPLPEMLQGFRIDD